MSVILVCGGRYYNDKYRVYKVLDQLLKYGLDLTIVHGSADGADLLAEQWAKERQVNYRGFPAKWLKFGRSGGPKRNREMLDKCPDLTGVIAFPGKTGTANMIKQAKANGLPVKEIEEIDYEDSIIRT